MENVFTQEATVGGGVEWGGKVWEAWSEVWRLTQAVNFSRTRVWWVVRLFGEPQLEFVGSLMPTPSFWEGGGRDVNMQIVT